MNCQKCGSNLVPGDSFCRNCGASINTLDGFQSINTNQIGQVVNGAYVSNVQSTNTQSSNINYNEQYNNLNQTQMNNNQYNNQNQISYGNQYDVDEDLKRAYVGIKYDDFKRGSGTIPVLIFFLGTFYTLYRKMYLLSILWIVGDVIINTFLPGIGTILLLGFKIFIMIKFKDLYLKHVSDEVEKIKLENPNRPREDLKNICAKKGGTNIAIVIVMAIVYLLFIIGIIFLIVIPIILGTIDSAKEGSQESSAYGYIDAVEKEIALDKLENQYYVVPYVIDEVDEDIVKGDAPDEVRLYLDSDGSIISGTLIYDDTTYEYINGQISVVE